MQQVMIQLKDVRKTYAGNRIAALDGIDLSITRGEIFGIIGQSGAGKSTLVRCMNLLERPTGGEVWIDGRELAHMPSKALRRARRGIGMIFQHFNLLQQRTALQNICFPLRIAGESQIQAEKRAHELLHIVGLDDRASAYPAQLSGGQRQRIAIARALATTPKILLCDEATSALDPSTTHAILSLLREINRTLGITIVMITHEMAVVEEICHRVAILAHGRVAETGAVQEVFAHPQSRIAKQLVCPEWQEQALHIAGKRCIRIVFDGSSSDHPVVAQMILRCKAAVNILFADMKNIDGRAFGQMVLQAPDDAETNRRMREYLTGQGVRMEEGLLDDWI